MFVELLEPTDLFTPVPPIETDPAGTLVTAAAGAKEEGVEADVEHAEEAAADHRQPGRGGPVRRAVGYTLTVLGSAVHRAVVLLVAVGLLAGLKAGACWCGLVP